MRDKPGAILVRRVRPWAENVAQQPRRPALPLSEDELAHAYRGIDGKVWPESLPTAVPRDDGLADVEHWPELASIAKRASDEFIYDAIILASADDTPPTAGGASFLGFDVGFYDDEYSVFSSIYNEALSSAFPGLAAFCKTLNGALLFADHDGATSYLSMRERLRREGSGVEDDDCYSIAIYG